MHLNTHLYIINCMYIMNQTSYLTSYFGKIPLIEFTYVIIWDIG